MWFFKKKYPTDIIPLDVPKNKHEDFIANYATITRKTGKLFLFAYDQKIEHLNDSCYGTDIPLESNSPEHAFRIAQHGEVGAMATQLGLINRYAKKYSRINYIAKLNSKTNLVKTDQKDPLSKTLWNIEDVMHTKKMYDIPICGVGFTVYLGSEFESTMLHEAAQIISKAHQHGLVTILWMYPRGKSVQNKHDGNLIAGAAGVANALGADFAKIFVPEDSDNMTSTQWLTVATQAAGNTKTICAGGKKADLDKLLKIVYNQIHQSKSSGAAIGKNIHQRPFKQAVALTRALSGIIYDNRTVEKAKRFLK